MKPPQGTFNPQHPRWCQRMELQNIENSYPLLPRRQLSSHPPGRTIQSITVISFDPLAAACLYQQSNKFNLYLTLIESITNREGPSKKPLMKCYYTEWIIEMGKDLLSNLVTARACMAPKSISYLNKEEWRGKQTGQEAEWRAPCVLTTPYLLKFTQRTSDWPKTQNWKLGLSDV